MQHYLGYPTNSSAACGADMTGRRNSRLDADATATTCGRCLAVLETIAEAEPAEAPRQHKIGDQVRFWLGGTPVLGTILFAVGTGAAAVRLPSGAEQIIDLDTIEAAA